MTTGPPDDHARQTYDAFAEHYDDFTANHRYDEWTATLEAVARRHGLTGNRLLDVACGTGKSFLPFAARGYDVTACDVSPRMLDLAREKAPTDVRLEVADMRELPVMGAFDLVCCLDDAVNYLLSSADLATSFEKMEANLASTGLLVFDVNTVRSYRDFYGGLNVVQGDDRVVVLDGSTSRSMQPGETASAATEVFHRSRGTWRRTRVEHHQRHHRRPVVEAALRSAGLVPLGVYGMQLDGSISDGFDELTNSKAVYVAGRAGSKR